MNLLKKNFALLSAAVVCLGLSACGGNNDYEDIGGDWRTWGIIRDGGTITRNGEDTYVLVCVNTEQATFYYNSESQDVFGFVDYPVALVDKVALSGDVWGMFNGIDFADLNGDGNSDVTMKFDDSGSELKVVWFWDTDSEQYMYQPDESNLGDVVEGRGDLILDEDIPEDDGRGDLIPEDDGRGDLIPEDDGRGDLIPEDDGRGDLIPEDDGRGDLIPEDDGRGDLIPEDDGRGDLIPDEGNMVPVLIGGALPFTNMENLRTENYEDGTYYYADVTEDGMIRVVNTVWSSYIDYDFQTVENYLTNCAAALAEADSCLLHSVEQNEEYTMNMSYPVYVVKYNAGDNEDECEWIVFAMVTDSHTYLYGICASLDEADFLETIYQDIFAGLYLSDGELEE
ncbi:MAG: hypothetical protein ACI4KF_02025 [Huintestinicola sp.]